MTGSQNEAGLQSEAGAYLTEADGMPEEFMHAHNNNNNKVMLTQAKKPSRHGKGAGVLPVWRQ